MARYDVTATVTISTTIEPQGQLEEPYGSEIEDFSVGNFNGYGNDIEESCEVTFTLITESEDEDDASSEAEEILGNLDYSGDDVAWEVTDVSIDSCEKQQMSVSEAVEKVRTFLDSREDAFREHHPAVFEALEVLLQQF
jgi:hypothetical protein